jgi:hypothetical protein
MIGIAGSALSHGGPDTSAQGSMTLVRPGDRRQHFVPATPRTFDDGQALQVKLPFGIRHGS